VVFADVDGDGDPDLLVNSMGGRNSLFLNDGHGRFSDATATSGFVAESRGSTTSALADIDGDGDLDLYVANYIVFDPKDPWPPFQKTMRRMKVMLGPQGLKGDPGAPAVSGYEIVESISPMNSDNKFRIVKCPTGKVAVGGGAFIQGDFTGHVALDASQPVGNTGWEAQAAEVVPNGLLWAVGVKVICVNAG